MDMTELLDAADSSPVSWRLEPKWLRDSLKRQSSMDLTESPEAADSSRVSQFGTVRKHVFYAILVNAVDDSNELNNKVNDSEKLWELIFDVPQARLNFGNSNHVSLQKMIFEVKLKSNGHVDLLDFAGILFEIRDKQEQVDELKSETKKSGKFLSLRKMWECVKNHTDNQLEEYDIDATAIVYFNYFWFLTTAFLVCCTKSVEQGFVMKDIIANELCFTSFDTADVYRMFIEGIIAEKRLFTILAAATTCSDLPCTVTGYEGTVTVDHWITFNNETSSVEYLEDSGDNGFLKLLKPFFKFLLISSVPVTVWWGG